MPARDDYSKPAGQHGERGQRGERGEAPGTLSAVLNDVGRVIGALAVGATHALHTATAGKPS